MDGGRFAVSEATEVKAIYQWYVEWADVLDLTVDFRDRDQASWHQLSMCRSRSPCLMIRTSSRCRRSSSGHRRTGRPTKVRTAAPRRSSDLPSRTNSFGCRVKCFRPRWVRMMRVLGTGPAGMHHVTFRYAPFSSSHLQAALKADFVAHAVERLHSQIVGLTPHGPKISVKRSSRLMFSPLSEAQCPG